MALKVRFLSPKLIICMMIFAAACMCCYLLHKSYLKRTALQKRRYFSLKPVKVNQYTFDSVITCNDLCDNYEELSFIFLIISNPSHRSQRDIIRNTWAKEAQATGRIATLFLLGYKPQYKDAIEQESMQCHDLIQDTFIDTYFNLTTKVHMGFRWATQNCQKATFVVKTDEDVVVNVALLLKISHSLPTKLALYGDVFAENSSPWRRGKWKVSEDEYPFSGYPAYLSGPFYIMSMDVAIEIIKVVEYIPKITIEDVYYTGIIAKVIGVVPRSYREYSNDPFYEWDLFRNIKEAYPIDKFTSERLVFLHTRINWIKTYDFEAAWKELKDYQSKTKTEVLD